MEGSQTPGSGTTHHITYRQGGDIGALQKLSVISIIKVKRQVDSIIGNYKLAPPRPTLLRHFGKNWSTPTPPLDANANVKYCVLNRG